MIAQPKTIHESELEALKVEMEALRAKHKELSDRFLVIATKLGSVCSAFGIDAGLEKKEFADAVNARRDEIRRGARP